MKEEHSISVRNLKKSFKNLNVLQQVNFDVKKGTIFSLLGSNGAGKTTIIKLLTSLMKPDDGTIEICGIDVCKNPKKLHEIISLTGQYAAVDETLTGFENLMMIANLHHIKHPSLRVEELFTYFDLTKAKDRLVSTYSGGMKRKLDIAMSLVNQPRVIFLDEPTTGLDPQSRRSMWDSIRNLKQQGITIFLTTQYLEEAEQLADEIAILDKGHILVKGTLSQLQELLPQGIVTCTFTNERDCDVALSILHNDNIFKDKEKCTLKIYTDGSIQSFYSLLHQLLSANLNLRDIQRITPSLEDVFIALIEEKEVLHHA